MTAGEPLGRRPARRTAHAALSRDHAAADGAPPSLDAPSDIFFTTLPPWLAAVGKFVGGPAGMAGGALLGGVIAGAGIAIRRTSRARRQVAEGRRAAADMPTWRSADLWRPALAPLSGTVVDTFLAVADAVKEVVKVTAETATGIAVHFAERRAATAVARDRGAGGGTDGAATPAFGPAVAQCAAALTLTMVAAVMMSSPVVLGAGVAVTGAFVIRRGFGAGPVAGAGPSAGAVRRRLLAAADDLTRLAASVAAAGQRWQEVRSAFDARCAGSDRPEPARIAADYARAEARLALGAMECRRAVRELRAFAARL